MIDIDIQTMIERKLMRDTDLRSPAQIVEMHHRVQAYQWQRAQPKTADIVIDNSDLREPLIVYPLGEKRTKLKLDFKRYEAVVFDFDGTVVNNVPHHFYSWMEFARRHGLELTKDIFSERYSGMPTKPILRDLLEQELSETALQKLYEERYKIYWETVSKYIQAVRGFESLLVALKSEGLKVALVTSASAASRNKVLHKLGISDSFDVVVGPEHVEHGKPHPEPYLRAAELVGVRPRHCLVFEDSRVGIASAKAAGMHVVGVLTTHVPEDLQEADIVINHYEDIEVAT